MWMGLRSQAQTTAPAHPQTQARPPIQARPQVQPQPQVKPKVKRKQKKEQRPSKKTSCPAAAESWVEGRTGDGHTYYYNTITGGEDILKNSSFLNRHFTETIMYRTFSHCIWILLGCSETFDCCIIFFVFRCFRIEVGKAMGFPRRKLRLCTTWTEWGYVSNSLVVKHFIIHSTFLM